MQFCICLCRKINYFYLRWCPCRTFQIFFFFYVSMAEPKREMAARKGQPIPMTTHRCGERAQLALALWSPAGLDGGALIRGEQIPLLTLAVLIYMWAFITCVGTDEHGLEMKNIFFSTLYSSGEILRCSYAPGVRHASLQVQAASRKNILLYSQGWLVASVSLLMSQLEDGL